MKNKYEDTETPYDYHQKRKSKRRSRRYNRDTDDESFFEKKRKKPRFDDPPLDFEDSEW